MATVYASIGNSDDKLSQREWAEFAEKFVRLVSYHAAVVHGVWWSAPDQPWQNCCIGFDIDDTAVPQPADYPRGHSRASYLKTQLRELRSRYRQDAIAWVPAMAAQMI